jgi:hypothetical protein
MIVVQNMFSWLDSALLLSMILVWLGNRYNLGLKIQRISIFLVSMVCLLPISGLSVFMYPHSLFGDLSMTSKTFMIAWLVYRLGGPVLTDMKEIRILLRGMAVFGLVFYPLALGLTPFDPYSAGYSASILIIWTVVIAAYGLKKGYSVLTVSMLVALWGYLLGILESDNLFDYLFDPLLFLYAVGFTCVTFLQNRKANNTVRQA